MKTNELIETSKQLGYVVFTGISEGGETRIFFYRNGHPADHVAHVSADHHKDLVIVEAESVSDDLFLAMTKYALTPKEEREETIYYRLLLDVPAAGLPLYFCKTNGIGGTNLNVWKNGKNNSHLLFTESQLEKINQKGFIKQEIEFR